MSRRMSLSALALLLAPAACSTYVEDRASEAWAPVYPVEEAGRLDSLPTGGIYSSTSRGLFVSDRRAARVGDIVTVDFHEKFSASKSQSASGSRKNDYEIDLPDALTLGLDDGVLDNSTDQGFSGKGAASQSNSLRGRMSVSVTRVLPGGNLEIMGQKLLTLNNGNEYVRLKGVVRPEDIGPDNVVTSDRIAHAEIKYIGAGDTADTAKPGWLRRGLSVVSPL
ncbi:flagellar basal body L-ring protein FlgH [Cereibacter johrii]|uniref:flagellar basal body L-ring protein FlgH n=1 Tax=Cereibacter johrii TaxID=445629 RepID=UPI000C6EC168|nr:flagellar basal body L-ring protein FlgH [Cereibacter johrii]MEA5160866.1 flagellar basal body L-ring protein FlgH [Cereibacter johrii]QCP85302.1 flagellar basal body L-ring protein FlgH [Cereibacter sphaeroides]RAZ83684.1 flagellar basal body L-ring protein FlgH [Cereibacter johrii]RDS94362.1 flagellar basal body L-ring protein FlgH [Cereibacter sphaeroides f. sp. denitrificans]